jgi:class 3 adenylate cyclase
MAGIVGRERYQFDIWGDTVNVAARLAGVASPGTVAVTEEMSADWCGGVSRGAAELRGKAACEWWKSLQ